VEPSEPRACSAAAALQVVGERWSLLVLRELFYGVRRFDAIARATGAPRNILTARLRHLEAEGVIERRQYADRPPRHEYHLTRSGRALLPVLLALLEWGDRYAVERPAAVLRHACGEELHVRHTCRACGDEVTSNRDLTLEFPAGDIGRSPAGPGRDAASAGDRDALASP
jgi:DNA-binding HxlR family transcriptional regulator